MTTKSQNGWPVIDSADSLMLRQWRVPASTGEFVLPLQRGHAGFVLVHFALWYAEDVEPVLGAGDDFGWARRPISGTTIFSNHASGTAEDLNSSKHPQGVDTFSTHMKNQMHTRLGQPYYVTAEGPALRWGGDYHTTIDQMHTEVNVSATALNKAYAACLVTARGQRIVAANP